VTATQRRAALDRQTHLASLLHHLDRYRRTLDGGSVLGAAGQRLLWLLTDDQPRSLRQIAEALHLEQSTVNRQVNAAVAGGHLARTRPPGGGPYVFTPTDQGRAAFHQETASTLDRYRDVLDQLGPEDTADLLRLLGRFVDLYGVAVEGTDAATDDPTSGS
jgi:DNA-binding MarR family transcriptional regulator